MAWPRSRPGLVAVALAMGRLIDDGRAKNQHPAAAKVLVSVLDKLASASAGGRRGRLALVKSNDEFTIGLSELTHRFRLLGVGSARVAHRHRDPQEMFFTLKLKSGAYPSVAGPPLFVGESLRLGEYATQWPRGEWVEVTVYAPDHGPGGPVMVIDQGEASLIRSLAAEKRRPEAETTDIYSEVETVDNHEKPQHRGTPTWDGDELEIDGNIYSPGKWSRSPCFVKGGPLAAPSRGQSLHARGAELPKSNPKQNLTQVPRPSAATMLLPLVSLLMV